MIDGQSTAATGDCDGVRLEGLGAAHPARRTDRARPFCQARHEDQMLDDIMLDDDFERRGVCGMRVWLSLSMLETGYRQFSAPCHHAIR